MNKGSTVIVLLVKFIPLFSPLIVVPDITVILSDGDIKLCIVFLLPDHEWHERRSGSFEEVLEWDY
jgi:hypothetical protein